MRSTIDQIFPFLRLWKKLEYNETVHQQFTDFKKAYGSVRKEVLFNILSDFSTPIKLPPKTQPSHQYLVCVSVRVWGEHPKGDSKQGNGPLIPVC
jgi:hypothetical protein